MNPYSSQGDHQVSCLPCGYLYGLSCIQRWIKHSNQRDSKCPICKRKCALKDVVKLYVSCLPVVERGKQENSVSFQPRDDLYKVHFAKYKEELADTKREAMNTKCCERIERTSSKMSMLKKCVNLMNSISRRLNTSSMRLLELNQACIVLRLSENIMPCFTYRFRTRKDLQMIAVLDRKIASMKRESEEQERKIKEQERKVMEQEKEIQATSKRLEVIERRTVETISGLRRKLEQQENELTEKDGRIELLM
ncbi:E3 ubiquitin-protein ligase RFWD3-like [Papaver somniferum]|uniref:E3 ubiquitin-protein ligase RFWD3-like n=1 Tax=Papaver somniferum TaxID=3469 RepID=UPI000E6F51A8|nr:E3 ubiquitin-protein ligase RFWD3-like [Papaver somniferum]